MRFKSITIENFKNVEYGELTFDNPRRPDGPSILALYGQNGSGKSAVVDCFKIFKCLAMGQKIPNEYAYYVMTGKEAARISYSFEVEDGKNNKGLVKYSVIFSGSIEPFDDDSFRAQHQKIKNLFASYYKNNPDEFDDEAQEWLSNSFSEDDLFHMGPGSISSVAILSEELMFRGANDKKLHTLFSFDHNKNAIAPKGLGDALMQYWQGRIDLDDEFGNSVSFSEQYLSSLHLDGRSIFFSKVCEKPIRDNGSVEASTILARFEGLRNTTSYGIVSLRDDESCLNGDKTEIANKISEMTKSLQIIIRLNAQYNMHVVESKDVESIESHQWLNFNCSKNEIKKYATVNDDEETIRFIERNSNQLDSEISEEQLFFKKLKNLEQYGVLQISTTDSSPSELLPPETDVVNGTLNYINFIIGAVIPGLQLKLHCDSGQGSLLFHQVDYVYLQSVRDGRAIPLSCESRGIQKIISIIFLLIDVYNNKESIAVVDELDAGIFEFLLGEILEVISQEGAGQLIFTSHNLRPLEVLDRGYIAFSTTNPSNRYIRLRNVKTTNNLRDFYYRSIIFGGQNERVYERITKGELSLAFMNSAYNLTGSSDPDTNMEIESATQES